MPDDTELLEQIGRGDQAAFRALLQRHGRYLYGVAHSLTASAQDAEDIVQETLMAVLTSRFRGESSVRTWLVRILVNRAAMLRRSNKRRAGTLTIDASTPGLPASAGRSGMRSEADATDAKLDLTSMLQVLSEDHREVVILRELEGLSYEEIAKMLSVPRGTVESRLHRAREELRRRFDGNQPES